MARSVDGGAEYAVELPVLAAPSPPVPDLRRGLDPVYGSM
jgi:hypothetical protein